ncbi:MAG: phosphohydrolase, partial [Candidatus Muiribacterium halophilum]
MKELKASYLDIILAIAEAVDLVSPNVNKHHKQVAVIAWNLAKEMGLHDKDTMTLFIAALLHDCGSVAFTLDDRLKTLDFDFENPNRHAVIGYHLLKDFSPLKQVAEIIKYHNARWFEGSGREHNGEKVPVHSFLIHLADRIAVSIDLNKEVLCQVEEIRNKIIDGEGMIFMPEIVDAFKRVSNCEYFWFDATNPDNLIREIVLKYNTDMIISEKELLYYAELFRRMIDFRSLFTSAHSIGVSVVATELAKKMGFSEGDVFLMKVAGLLHDIGKIAIPLEILEKPASLTKDEFNIIKTHVYHSYRMLEKIPGFHKINAWASLHHEKLNGTGYPFHYKVDKLALGSRIMAVADVFVAISEDRPYRDGMKEQQALNVLDSMEKADQIDSKVVKCLKEDYENINNLRKDAQKRIMEEFDNFLYS